jgi:Starch-binding associating with outer membrane
MTFRFAQWMVRVTGLLTLTACTDRFADINTDPTTTTSATPDQLFSRALKYGTLYDSDFEVGEHLHANMWVQYFANSKPEVKTDRYESDDAHASKFWDHFYTGYGMDLQQAIQLLRDDPTQVNRLSQARIWRAYLFQRMTDYWGDIPYSQAFGGASAANTQPAYDAQSAIYASMLRELAEAAAALDNTQPGNFGPADLLYANPDAVNPASAPALANLRWQHFANSLRLRMAMRLSEVDPALAAAQVRAALAGGVMQSSPESAVMRNTGGSIRINQNPLAVVLGFDYSRISATLIDYLTRYRDPRLAVFAKPVAGSAATWRGLPNGLSVTQLTLPQYNPNNFSAAGQQYQAADNNQNILTYAEVCFLRAEACWRGWDAAGSAESWYNAGIREALVLAGITSPAVADTYLQQPGVRYQASQAQEQIITQKWLLLFGHNGFEAFAEYRRTGFPTLRAGLSPGETNGQLPKRLRYPAIEQRLNLASYQQAVSRQGPDAMTTPVWWDK